MRTVIGYHLGWVDADGRPADLGGGKSVRATLALLSARAAGGTDADGLPGAVAVELVHTFSLLHDDIMDGDDERHHRPTAWAVFGRARAILAGDAVLALAFRVLLDAGSTHRATALDSLADATARLIDGQAVDLDLEGRVDVTPEQCTRMCAGKTGALLECAASIGAVLAGAGDEVVLQLRAFGGHLGLAFQAVDDLLGIWGDPAVTGKPVFGDLVQPQELAARGDRARFRRRRRPPAGRAAGPRPPRCGRPRGCRRPGGVVRRPGGSGRAGRGAARPGARRARVGADRRRGARRYGRDRPVRRRPRVLGGACAPPRRGACARWSTTSRAVIPSQIRTGTP